MTVTPVTGPGWPTPGMGAPGKSPGDAPIPGGGKAMRPHQAGEARSPQVKEETGPT